MWTQTVIYKTQTVGMWARQVPSHISVGSRPTAVIDSMCTKQNVP